MLHPALYIAESGEKGRGIFTSEDLDAGVLIESSPVIVLPPEDRPLIDRTRLHDYIFEWGDNKEGCCMALGWIALYNHASPSNCEYEMDFEADLIRVRTVRAVDAGEELSINYNGDADNTEPVWFETI
ncbi:MAG TPA: SET domain-containing protein [Chitinophagaceae bacterium]|nr:SET domain-containing protein [Chitinophagaceae bacterium]